MSTSNPFSQLKVQRDEDSEEEFKEVKKSTNPEESKKKKKVRPQKDESQQQKSAEDDTDFQEVVKHKHKESSRKYENEDQQNYGKKKEYHQKRDDVKYHVKDESKPQRKREFERRSGTGRGREISKGGAGGKGTWGTNPKNISKNYDYDDYNNDEYYINNALNPENEKKYHKKKDNRNYNKNKENEENNEKNDEEKNEDDKNEGEDDKKDDKKDEKKDEKKDDKKDDKKDEKKEEKKDENEEQKENEEEKKENEEEQKEENKPKKIYDPRLYDYDKYQLVDFGEESYTRLSKEITESNGVMWLGKLSPSKIENLFDPYNLILESINNHKKELKLKFDEDQATQENKLNEGDLKARKQLLNIFLKGKEVYENIKDNLRGVLSGSIHNPMEGLEDDEEEAQDEEQFAHDMHVLVDYYINDDFELINEILKGKNIPGFYGLDKDAPVEKEEEFDLNVLDNIIN